MSEKIEFTNNYHDLSTKKGFQFEFRCNRCGSGFRTEFQTFAIGAVSDLMDTAGSIFGGLFGKAASASERIRSSAWEKAHDEAFLKAGNEIKPEFIQCPRCSTWVCRKGCWNVKKGLCKNCAPDLGVEMAAAQASKSVEEIWAHAAMAEEDKKLDTASWREGITATCPKCEAPMPANVKFCPECGEPLKKSENCPECNAKLTLGAKFCPECGKKI